MSVNKDELKELIEGNLFGEQDFSLDDLMQEAGEEVEKPVETKETAQESNNEIDIDLGLEEESDNGTLAGMIKDLEEDDFLGDLLTEETDAAEDFEPEDILDNTVESEDYSEPVIVESEDLPQLDTDVNLEFDDKENPEILDEMTTDDDEITSDEGYDFLKEDYTINKISETEIPKFNDNFKDEVKDPDINNFGFEEINIDNYKAENKPEPELQKSKFHIEQEVSEIKGNEINTEKAEPKEPEEPLKQEKDDKVDYVNVKPIEFPILEEQIAGRNFDLDFFSNIPVKIEVFLGQSEISLKEVYELSEGSIIELDKMFGEPLELKINGQLVARGEVVAVDNHYGIMLKEIVKPRK